MSDDSAVRDSSLAKSPLLTALWETLPAEPPFTAESRRRFFVTLAVNLDYVYGPVDIDWFDPVTMAELGKATAYEPPLY